MFAKYKYGFITWMKNGVDPDQLAKADLDLHCLHFEQKKIEPRHAKPCLMPFANKKAQISLRIRTV